MSSLRLVQFNVENLFVLMDQPLLATVEALSEDQWRKLSISTTPNKPIEQVRAIARCLCELDPDIIMLCEVGGVESLRHFNRYFLNDEYTPYLIEGNSDRGIDLGYLVRKSLPFQFDLISHKSRSIDFLYPHERLSKQTGYADIPSGRLNSHRFSRDVLELRVFSPDQSQPQLILLLVHLKSQLDRDKIDPQGRDRRRAELEKLVKIYLEIENDFQGQVPIILAGDFNGRVGFAAADPEFAALYQETQLRDILELAQVPEDQRFTYMQIQGRGASQNKQLDYIFVSPLWQSRVQKEGCFVYRFKDKMGMNLALPQNMASKRLLPSDHYPVVATFNLEWRT